MITNIKMSDQKTFTWFHLVFSGKSTCFLQLARLHTVQQSASGFRIAK